MFHVQVKLVQTEEKIKGNHCPSLYYEAGSKVMFTNFDGAALSEADSKLKVSIGQTVTQMPQPIQELFAL